MHISNERKLMQVYFKTKSYAITEVPSVGIDIDWGSSINHVDSFLQILVNIRSQLLLRKF